MENKDKCVMCGVETPYDVLTHVDYRYNYVDGIGQMCADCHRKGNGPIEQILIPKEYIKLFPNDMELGHAVRQFYNEHYK